MIVKSARKSNYAKMSFVGHGSGTANVSVGNSDDSHYTYYFSVKGNDEELDVIRRFCLAVNEAAENSRK